ncbi:MAG: sugar-transfer associated ATP-grasp domain-containing protein [Patescibacteria group bacterium]
MFNIIKNRNRVLGMNSRNLDYVRPNNLLEAKRLADNKLLSKKILKKNDIPVPNLIAKIKNREDLENFAWQTLPDTFALKPNRGFGGEGILVVYGKKKPARNGFAIGDAGGNHEDTWIKADGSLVTVDDLKNHIRNILDGSFSLSNTPDTAFFEERLQLLKLFKPYAFKGIPDIRVIVFNKVPVMAMLRLPTKESGGKANLQQQAIGVGIDMASGITTTAIQGKNKPIEQIPNTRLILSGIKIPYWKDILTLAVRTQEISSLGFLGADVAIDKERGPVILELNARPGLSIQLANRAGLKERMERVAGLKIKTLEKGVRVGMDLFGGEIVEELEEISGRKVIGTVEKIKLIGKDGKEIEVKAKIDTGAGLSSIDNDLAYQLGFQETMEAFSRKNFPASLTPEQARELDKQNKEQLLKEVPNLADTAIIHSSHGTTYRPMVGINISLRNIIVPAKVSVIDRANLKYPVILGKKNLGKFLIDVNK